METDPLQQAQPPAAPPDPWNGPSAPHSQLTPHHTPDPLPPADPPDFGFGGSAAMSSTMLMMAEHFCSRLTQCGNTSPNVTLYCNAVTDVQRNLPAPPACAERDRCLQHLDTLGCSSPLDDASGIATVVAEFADCMDAIQRC
jgi:hypothetical protein